MTQEKTAEERNAEAIEYVRRTSWGTSMHRQALLAILTPPPKRHTFGGLVFEETGEVRRSEAGEFYEHEGTLYCDSQGSSMCRYSILRFVGPASEVE